MKGAPAVFLFCVLLFSCGRKAPAENGSVQAEGLPDSASREIELPAVHPSFTITPGELMDLTGSLPEAIAGNIAADPYGFLQTVDAVLRLPEERVLLVDKLHALTEDYAPDDLIELDTTPLAVNKTGMSLREVVLPDLLEMSDAASREGMTLLVSSAYRSYDYQREVFNYHVNTIGEEQAKRESAEPGKSQHQLGTTVDFGSITHAFADTAEGKWLMDHAYEYGFSLSYPEGGEELTGYLYEPWHYRWIGREAADLERRFFNGSQQHMLTFLHEHRSELTEKWNY